jgi:hypothetical protein
MKQHTVFFPQKILSILCRLIVISVLLAGCNTAVGPEYQSPSPQLPETWQITETADNLSSFEPTALFDEWWRVFDDPDLTRLVADVKEQNRDLAAATARLDSYAAAYGVARSGLMPMINAQGGISRERESERVRNPANQSIAGNPTWMYQAGFVMSWEIDVWHKIRRSMEAARGEWDASIQDRQNRRGQRGFLPGFNPGRPVFPGVHGFRGVLFVCRAKTQYRPLFHLAGLHRRVDQKPGSDGTSRHKGRPGPV